MIENPPLATHSSHNPQKHYASHKEIVKRAKKRVQNVPTVSNIKIVDFNGDITKSWYVEFYTIIEGERQRHRVKGGLNRIKDQKKRLAVALAMVEELKLATAHASYELVKYGYANEPVNIDSPIAKEAMLEALERKRNKVSEASFREFRSAVNNFLKFYGKGKLHEISWQTISDYALSLYAQELAHKTIHSRVNNLRNVCEYLKLDPIIWKEHGLRDFTSGESIIPWTDEEFEKLKEFTADKINLQVYWGLIYYCAIRPKEISFLKKENIDLASGLMTIYSEQSKNKKTQNVIIPFPFRPILSRYLADLPVGYYLLGNNLLPSAKRAISNKYANTFAKEVKDPLGITKNAYQLKHTAAIHLVRSNMNKTAIQHHFRHASVEETETYLRHFEGHIFREIESAFD